jgi:hypothetical protein
MSTIISVDVIEMFQVWMVAFRDRWMLQPPEFTNSRYSQPGWVFHDHYTGIVGKIRVPNPRTEPWFNQMIQSGTAADMDALIAAFTRLSLDSRSAADADHRDGSAALSGNADHRDGSAEPRGRIQQADAVPNKWAQAYLSFIQFELLEEAYKQDEKGVLVSKALPAWYRAKGWGIPPKWICEKKDE